MKLLYLPLFIAVVYTQTCTSPRERKEIRDLTSDELYRFTDAVRSLHNTQYSNTNLSIHEQFTKVHNENHEISHSVPRFLPWHRHFIRLYEMELQKIDSSVMLPYWDWSIDAQAPQDSLVLSDWYFGSNGNSNNTYCVQDGEFAYMTLKYDTDHCLQRSYDLGSKISKFAIPEVINPFLNLKKFSDFEDNVEQVHADPHNNIGGGMDFTQMISPNDPLFYLHHSFMDLLWYNWQRRNPKSLQYDGDV
ncbi:Di-copper centre-containing protein, partial [Neoconidiobolus thromboides FSU 785]